MPDQMNPVIEITLGGTKRHLRCTLKSMRLFQELSDINIHKDNVDVFNLEAAQFRQLVWCCLVKEDREQLTQDDVEELVDRHNVFDVAAKILEAVTISFPAIKKKEKGETEENPPLAKNPPAG